MNFTYDQFKKAAEEAGLFNSFSEADLQLAKKTPAAGMSLLNYKKDYVNAPTDEARALANEGANKVRSSYGNYQGGVDGSGFYLEAPSPIGYNNGVERPIYSSTYGNTIKDKVNELLNKEKFSYNPENDQLYSSYKKQYTREGQRATEDAIGQAAAMSGGVPSTYAATAGAQAGNYYASQMADKIPELYQLAYNQYMNDIENTRANINVLNALDEAEYNKHLTELDQYNADRNFGYGQYLDEINQNTAERAEALEKAIAASQYGDFTLLKKLGITPDAEYLANLSNTSDGTTLGEGALISGSDVGKSIIEDIISKAYENGGLVDARDYAILSNAYSEDELKAWGIHIKEPDLLGNEESITNHKQAISYLKKIGIKNPQVMEHREWLKEKQGGNSMALDFKTYADYLYDIVFNYYLGGYAG